MGNPRVLVLDEPTAGVDAAGKVAMRAMIRKLKTPDRVILLTTHAMNEAEVLSDYTAILAHGRLQCEAPTQELKRKYGIGYYLHVAKKQTRGSAAGAGAGAGAGGGTATAGDEALHQLVAKHVPGAVVARESLLETLFVLPMGASATFHPLLSALDGSGYAGSYGVEMPSLEEVFIRITREADDRVARQQARDKAAKVLKRVLEQNTCCGSRSCMNTKQRAAVEAAEAELAKRDAALNGTSSGAGSDVTIDCPGLGCGSKVTAPASQLMVTCPSCHATFSRATAVTLAAHAAGDGDKSSSEQELSSSSRRGGWRQVGSVTSQDGTATRAAAGAVASSSGGSAASQQPKRSSFGGQYRAFLRFLRHSERKALYAVLITLCFYLPVAAFNSSFSEGAQTRALVTPPQGLPADYLDPRGGGKATLAVAWGVVATTAAVGQQLASALQANGNATVPVTMFDTLEAMQAWVIRTNSSVPRAGFAVDGGSLGSEVTLLMLDSYSGVEGMPYIMLSQYQRALYGSVLNATAAPQVLPTYAGPNMVSFRATALVSMYVALLAVIVVQNFAAGAAGDVEKGRRHQMSAMGMRSSVYYLALVTVHGAVALLCSVAWTALVFLVGLDFATGSPAGAIVLLIFLCNFVNLILGYVVAVALRKVSSFITAMVIILFATMTPGMLWLSVPGMQLHAGLDIIPAGALTQAFVVLDKAASQSMLQEELGCTTCGLTELTGSNVFSSAGVAAPLLFLVCEGVVLLVALVLLERYHTRKNKATGGPSMASTQAVGAAAAADDAEAARSPLVVEDVHKTFAGKGCAGSPLCRGEATEVLKGVDLTVRAGSLTALLGPNGSGKSTTFKVIAGGLRATSGSVRFNGCDINTSAGHAERDRRLYLAQQHTDSTLNGIASVRNHIELYAAIKGLSRSQAVKTASDVLAMMDLGDRADVPVGELSGGEGRKGCAALALLGTVIEGHRRGGDVVVLLDEISAGVDVSARRRMWATLAECHGSLAGILCTHHMEEADSLCDSIAVLVKGKVVATGGSQALKLQYGNDLQLHLTCSEEAVADPESLRLYMDRNVGKGAKVVDVSSRSRHVVLAIPKGSKPLAAMFAALEASKGADGPGVVDYSLAQPTLEQVYLKLVRMHSDGEEEAGGAKQ